MQMAMEPSSSITSIANENNLIFAADSKAGAEDTGVSDMPTLPQDVALEISHPAMETDSDEIEWYDDLADALTGEKRCDLSVVRKITNCGIFPDRLRLSAWHACLGNAPDPSFVLSVKSNTVQNDVIPDSISILIDQNKAKRNTADPYDADTRRLFAAILSSLSAGPVNESPLNSRELQAEFVAALTVVHDVVIKADAQSNHESPSKEVCMRSLFVSVLDFIPSNINSALQLLRLIIQYHDPELSLFLDSKKLFVPAASSKSRSIAADSTYGSKQPPHKMVFERWLLSLLSSDVVTFDAVIPIWDMYFQHHDPYLIFFVILVLLINIKDTLLSQSFESTEAIETLTPSSFRACCYSELFESVKTANPGAVSVAASVALMPKEQARSGKSQQQPLPRNSSTNNLETKPYYYKSNMHIPVDQALCLPVTAEELLESLYMPDDATAGGGSSMGTASNASNSSMSTAPAPTTLAASTSALKFFIIDCRSSDDYNECHLSMAFHLEASLICTDPVNFSTALDTLLQHQSEVTAAINSGNALVGEHICFLGYGTDPLTTSSAAARDQHDQYMFMVQSRLLQRGKKMISSLDGGFAEIMLYCSELDLVGREELLHGSDVHKHLAPPKSPSRSQPQQQQQALRGPGGQTQQGWGKLFKNLVSQVKHQAEEYKEKLETYMDPYIEAAMRSPSSAGTDDGSPDRYDEENVDRRGGRLDNVGRPMLMSLRSVTSETEEGLSPTRRRQQQQRRRTSDAGNYEYVNMNDFLRRIDNHLTAHFRAGEILHALSEVPPVPCTLVLTRTQLIIMRHLTAQQQEQFEGHHINGTIVARRSLDAVVKITAKKQCPEVVTIKYGTVDGDEFYITDMDRFFIPEAKNAVDQIKHAVLTLCESLDKGEKSGDDGDAEGGGTSSVDVENVEMTESSMEVMDEPNAAKKPEILSVHGSTSAPSLDVEMPENSQSNRVLAAESGEQMQTLSASATGGQQLKKPLEQTASNVTEAGSGDAGRSAVTSSPRPLTKKQKQAAKQQGRNTQSSAEMRSVTGSGVGGDGMINSNNDDGLFSI